MKDRASLLKSLTHIDHCSKTCLAHFAPDCKKAFASGNLKELAHTSRQIARVQLNMMKLSRELVAVSDQIRALTESNSRVASLPLRKAWDGLNGDCELDETNSDPQFAFTAIISEKGAVIARVEANSSVMRLQPEYGCFETWTQAQDFAGVLNQSYGIGLFEAQHIIVSANLAAR